MNKSNFDQYAGEYDQILLRSIPSGLDESGYFAEYKVALMERRLINKKGIRILDFGCGSGRSLPYLEKHFPEAELWGYDISPASLKIASDNSTRVRLISNWDECIKIQFDAIIAANVFHHIPPAERLLALTRCRSVLNKHGQMFLFEHNPYNPITRRIFERCPFDADAEMIKLKTVLSLALQAGYKSAKYGYTLFFPKQLGFLRGIETLLRNVPLGAQYYVQMAR